MSNPQPTAAPVANLALARKEQAAARKTPAKKGPAKAPAKLAEKKAEKKAEGTVYVYESGPSRAGLVNKRSFPHQVSVAADVQDPQHTSRRWQQGVITRFFVNEKSAQRYKERLESEGCNVQLLPVRLVSKEA
ncbi:hypothetical protein K3U93_18530 [Mycobacterium malmoense]|uniref:SPOR domain-containing protein n=1 Tax=Mycobacterium malmoense TaxID=1780 RepID=A0ABX3STG0_MYCMA|nr:hypothetical protein [Mycobacterium malmoense]OIN82678.1 hypothetical protein BMG05_01060 [Mycobacterium malmoense]ORA82088.1 hypothetical protein BST29_12920 [Mycobacterium malmoense]QZA16631.1 hypothetical protein K3U93_18530 [Mycobacterium malmoense]UNB93431.1 hypothetical protein H5T25_18515 [Mycobacterium malmoense]